MLYYHVEHDTGKPRLGPIFSNIYYKKDKVLYKKCIGEGQISQTSSYTNDLHDALLKKNGQAFWQVWNSKFRNKAPAVIQVDGKSDNTVIANTFANYFARNCSPLSNDLNHAFSLRYEELREQYTGSPIARSQLFDVELISNLINKMDNGKAAGLDNLTSEHLKFSHPIVVCILTNLFNLFISNGHIPIGFGESYTVPIPKCEGRMHSLSHDDFRGISISCVISKLFEMSIIDRYSIYFETSDNQFGFKKNIGCRDAIYCVRNVIEHFVSNGSTVNVCALDLSKAFDRMNHYVLYIKLMDRKIPIQLLTIFESWFNSSTTCIRWNGHVSHCFSLAAGVRQGGVLSPLLFAIFIDTIVDRIKTVNAGCYINTICCSIFLYADDMLLLAPTISGLQSLVRTCENYLIDVDMCVNVKKSICIRFGRRYNFPCTELTSVFGGVIQWVESCRYLGVFFKSGFTFKCNFENAKSSFFRAFNALYSKVGRLASEEVVLSLIRAKCLPILLYATEACPLLSRNRQSFEFTVTRLFMKLFHTASPVVVKCCQQAFNFLPIQSQLDIRTAKFLQKFIVSKNSLCSIFSFTARCKLNEMFARYDNVVTACQLHNAILDSFLK
jgi:hypothetical protein